MNKNHLLLQGKAWAFMLLAAGAVSLTSCDDVYDGDETWRSDVRNTVLESPKAEDITLTPNTDGSKTTISWPVVYGAGGYICSVLDMSDPDNPVAVNGIRDSLIDATSIEVTREEDVNYRFSIRTAGNAQLNNTEAETTTQVDFSTFTATYATIPSGTDLAEYFAANPVPESATTEMVNYDLEPNGTYTMSAAVDFLNRQVTLRTSSKDLRANITFTGEDASFKTGTLFTLKYVDVDAAASTEPFIMLTEQADASIVGATGSGDYYNIMGAIVINGCNIDNVRDYLIYDGDIKYCLETFLIQNSVIHLTSENSSNAAIFFKTGYINDLTVRNSTVWNSGAVTTQYFVRYNNSGRCDRAGYSSNSVNFMNSTFYNVASNQWANYSGFAGRNTSNWVMTNNIFVNCSEGIARRFLGGRGNQNTATFANNTYMSAPGTFDSVDGSAAPYDNSGTAIEEDPAFTNPTEGNFTVNGSMQLEKRTGDPRWLPEAEEE